MPQPTCGNKCEVREPTPDLPAPKRITRKVKESTPDQIARKGAGEIASSPIPGFPANRYLMILALTTWPITLVVLHTRRTKEARLTGVGHSVSP